MRLACFLGQTKAAHGAGNLDHQTGFDLEFFGIRQAKVGEDVPRASLDLDAFNHALYHVVTPLLAPPQPSVWRE